MKSKPAGISEKVVRLLEIYTMIAQRQYPSVPLLREHFHVSERSVYRYLEIVNMIDGIEYDQERKGYTFTCGDRIKKLSLSDNELLVLFTASEAVSHLGESLGHGFQELMHRMTAAAGKTGVDPKRPITVRMPEVVGNERVGEYLACLSACLDERRSVELTYRAQTTKELTTRLVDPYGMVFYDGTWTVIGYCHLRKEIRSFALDRIVDLKERYRYFTPSSDFSLDEFLSRSWGIVDDEEVIVRVRFSSVVADYVLRRKWHPSEVRVILPGGDVEMTYRVAGVVEIKHWIYSWLPNVEVLEPPWLRAQVGRELRESAKNHT
jgi:predicted DNA-binding transcriptional regulator YafY